MSADQFMLAIRCNRRYGGLIGKKLAVKNKWQIESYSFQLRIDKVV